MKLKLQKRLASKILGAGKKRIKFDSSRQADIKEAITKGDVRRLIGEKAVSKKQKKGHSRYNARKILEQKRKDRRKGKGSRKGKATSRLPRKDIWVSKIRLQRKMLRKLKDEGQLSTSNYNMLRRKAKGGFFRSKRHLDIFIKDNNLLEEKYDK